MLLLRKIPKKNLWRAWVLVFALCLSGCGIASAVQKRQARQMPGGGEEKLTVAVTLFPYYDFIRQIAGDQVELTLVVPAGMDSHSFEPTPADMRLIQNADVLICNGGSMEHWLFQVLEAIGRSDQVVVAMMDYVNVLEEETVEGMEEEAHEHKYDVGQEYNQEYGHEQEYEQEYGWEQHEDEQEHDNNHEYVMGHEKKHDVRPQIKNKTCDSEEYDSHAFHEYDEHIWTSPVNAMESVKVIRDVLCREDPAHSKDYEKRAEIYLSDLGRIDADLRQLSKERKRNMIILGDKFPFRYLADEYGLEYRAAFSGCSTDTEPAARTIAYLIEQVRQQQIPVVYYLELSSPRVAEIIGEETGAQPLLLHSCHQVTRRQFEDGVTYVELMEQNIVNLRKGLVE